MKGLSVFIHGKLAGHVLANDGAISFEYEDNYSGTPLSLSMPTEVKKYNQKYILPWLEGAIPSSYAQRQGIALSNELPKNNPIEILGVMGLDCAGAIQFTRIGEEDRIEDGILQRVKDRYVADTAIRDHLSPDYYKPWAAEGMNWSLSGCQKKGVFTRLGNAWYAGFGATVSNYIVKPGIPNLFLEAFNEALITNLAKFCGIETEEIEYQIINGASCIVIKRFDRDDDLNRIHQEDFCQLLHYSPEKKYAADGGPSAVSILKAIHKYSGMFMYYNLYNFTSQLFFNYLTLATDAHAQNYSMRILYNRHGQLTPLYDCASYAPYANLNDRHHPLRLAMSIGGENRYGKLSNTNINKYVEASQLGKTEVTNILDDIIYLIKNRFDNAFAKTVNGLTGNLEVYEKFYKDLKKKIITHCNIIEKNMKR